MPSEPSEDASDEARGASFGKYQLIADIGHGGMAEVYLALARGPMGFNKLVVIKRLRLAFDGLTHFVQMFLDEARLAARLNHPNVVHTYEVGESDATYFIAMEYLEGQSLRSLVRAATAAGKPLPIDVGLRVVADVLEGLHYAHELTDYDGRLLQIVHRDVSPHNIFITYDGQVKLVDFGVAKAVVNQLRTETGTLKGKASYMAPEQANCERVDRRADVFAAGIVLWELVTGARLFPGHTMQALHLLMNEPIPTPRSVVPTLSPAIDAIVVKALARDRDARFATALEMGEAIEAHLRERSVVVDPRAVAAHMNHLFSGARERIRAQVQAELAVAHTATSEKDLAVIAMGVGPSVAAFPAADTLPRARPPSASSTPSPASVTGTAQSVAPPHDRAPSPPERRFPVVTLAALAMVTIVGALGGVVASRTSVGVARRGLASAPSFTLVPYAAAYPTATAAPMTTATTATAPAIVEGSPSASPPTTSPTSPSAIATPPSRAASARALPPSPAHKAEPPRREALTSSALIWPAAPSAAVNARAASSAPAAAPSAKPEGACASPFFVDERGLRRPKPECL